MLIDQHWQMLGSSRASLELFSRHIVGRKFGFTPYSAVLVRIFEIDELGCFLGSD